MNPPIRFDFKTLAIAAMCWTLSLAAGRADAQWGNLKVTFKADKAVTRQNADGVASANCGVGEVQLEDVVIDPKTLALANVVLFLDDKGDTPKIHASYNEVAGQKVVMDNKACRFEPHVAVLWTKQTLEIRNSDQIGHNSKVDAFDNQSINPIIPPGGKVDANFPNAEAVPMTVSCNIHRWMKGYLVVKSHPYAAASGADGVLELKNLPAGEVDFRAWHESGYVTDVKVNGKSTSWKKGRFSLDIPSGKTLELEVVVAADSLK